MMMEVGAASIIKKNSKIHVQDESQGKWQEDNRETEKCQEKNQEKC